MGDLLVSVLGGIVLPMLLVAAVAHHYATGRPAIVMPKLGGRRHARTYNPAPAVEAPEPLRSDAEVAEVADKTAWLAVMAEAMTVVDDLTGGELVPAVEPTPEIPDDAVAVDMAAVMVQQDIEEGQEFARWIESRVALETAVSFGFIRLDTVGAPR